MKFLQKRADSNIFSQQILYRENAADNNRNLKELLILEQYHFCAYTEKYLQPLDSVEVEHFNSKLKYHDGYYNYYAVIRNANLYKKDEKYDDASFFASRFFQDGQQLKQRIGFTNNIYYEIDEDDDEAKDLIDFLGFNHPTLSEQRSKHIKRLKETFAQAKYSADDILEYFKNDKDQLSFSTAIEKEFNIDLKEIIES